MCSKNEYIHIFTSYSHLIHILHFLVELVYNYPLSTKSPNIVTKTPPGRQDELNWNFQDILL